MLNGVPHPSPQWELGIMRMLKITCISKEIKTKIWAAAKLPRSAQEDVGENLKGASKAVLNQHPDKKFVDKFQYLEKAGHPDIPDCRTCYEIKEEGERRPYASLGAEAGHAAHTIAECLELHGRMDGLTPRTARLMCPIWTFGST